MSLTTPRSRRQILRAGAALAMTARLGRATRSAAQTPVVPTITPFAASAIVSDDLTRTDLALLAAYGIRTIVVTADTPADVIADARELTLDTALLIDADGDLPAQYARATDESFPRVIVPTTLRAIPEAIRQHYAGEIVMAAPLDTLTGGTGVLAAMAVDVTDDPLVDPTSLLAKLPETNALPLLVFDASDDLATRPTRDIAIAEMLTTALAGAKGATIYSAPESNAPPVFTYEPGAPLTIAGSTTVFAQLSWQPAIDPATGYRGYVKSTDLVGGVLLSGAIVATPDVAAFTTSPLATAITTRRGTSGG